MRVEAQVRPPAQSVRREYDVGPKRNAQVLWVVLLRDFAASRGSAWAGELGSA